MIAFCSILYLWDSYTFKAVKMNKIELSAFVYEFLSIIIYSLFIWKNENFPNGSIISNTVRIITVLPPVAHMGNFSSAATRTGIAGFDLCISSINW